jgi:hypothetical protein
MQERNPLEIRSIRVATPKGMPWQKSPRHKDNVYRNIFLCAFESLWQANANHVFVKRVLLTVVLMAAMFPIAAAQSVSVDAKTDSSTIVMGNWFRFSLDVKHPASAILAMPQLKDSIGKFSIVREESLSVSRSGDTVTEHKEFFLSAYEPGQMSIPAIEFAYHNGSDTTRQSIFSNQIGIAVTGVEVDSAQGIKDVKEPLHLPLTWREILLYTGIALLLAAIVYAAFYFRKKFKKTPAEKEIIVPPRAAHIVAFEKLQTLEEQHLWQQGEVKAFYSAVTEIVREYFERRYEILALEMTTDEVLDQLRTKSIDNGTLHDIAALLFDADLVKFAKYVPVPSECESVIPSARDIVDQTKIVEVVVPNA